MWEFVRLEGSEICWEMVNRMINQFNFSIYFQTSGKVLAVQYCDLYYQPYKFFQVSLKFAELTAILAYFYTYIYLESCCFALVQGEDWYEMDLLPFIFQHCKHSFVYLKCLLIQNKQFVGC